MKGNGIYTHLISDHVHYWEEGGATYHYRYNSWENIRGQEGDKWKCLPELIAECDDSCLQNKDGMYFHATKDLQRHDAVNRKYVKCEADTALAQTVNGGLEFIDVNAMGGSIRVTDAGLRFGYSFYDTQKKNVEEYGFVYAQGEKENNEITVDDVDSSNVLQLTAYNRLTHDDETTTYNLVFIDIPQTAYNTEISARAYVKIDGIYYYSDTLCYSFNDIAQKVMTDDEIDQNTKNSLNNLLEV